MQILHDVELKVKRGEVHALLGENGAGKSTTINIISTLLLKDEGEVFVDGLNIDKQASEIRSKIGIVFQGYVLDKRLSVKDNLKIRASYYGIYGEAWKKRFAELSEVFSLDEIKGREYGKLSGGQRRRVDIARALINRPKILILDEPTNHLDIEAREWVEEAVEAFDGTLLFVSHDRYFINRFATRIWELADGTITDYPMGFTQYQAVKAQEKQERTPAPVREKKGDTRPAKGNRSQQAARRQLTICENTISKLETEIADLDGQMQQVGRDPDKLAEVYAKKMETENTLQEQMARWEELSLQLEE